jgi:hypothetical protein
MRRSVRSAGGQLDRLGIGPGLADAIRRTRRQIFGASAEMRGGEEWPWTTLRRQPSELESMRRLRERLDESPASQHA